MIEPRINVFMVVTTLDIKYKPYPTLRVHDNRRSRGSSWPLYEQHLPRFNSFELAGSTCERALINRLPVKSEINYAVKCESMYKYTLWYMQTELKKWNFSDTNFTCASIMPEYPCQCSETGSHGMSLRFSREIMEWIDGNFQMLRKIPNLPQNI
jgi:hypothetical protein